jgi:hypothetical protein
VVRTLVSEEIRHGYEGYTIILCGPTDQCTEHDYGTDGTGHVPDGKMLERFKVCMEETNFNLLAWGRW